MSFVTRCPACQTLFTVQDEVLSPSEGRGRCSACQHVFNAFEHRYQPAATPEPPAPEPTGEEIEITGAEAAGAESRNHEEPQTLENSGDQEVSGMDLISVAEEIFPEPPPIAVPETLFQKRRTDWSRLLKPMMAVILLLVLLLAQSALFFRTALVANYPRSYPILKTACRLFNCTVPLPRRAELIQIEDDSLRSDPDHVDVLVLDGLIKNSAPFPQTYPMLQLTLTSKPRVPVASRPFTPEEYLAKGTDINAGMAVGAAVSVHLNLGVVNNQSNSYQLIAKNVPIPKLLAP